MCMETNFKNLHIHSLRLSPLNKAVYGISHSSSSQLRTDDGLESGVAGAGRGGRGGDARLGINVVYLMEWARVVLMIS